MEERTDFIKSASRPLMRKLPSRSMPGVTKTSPTRISSSISTRRSVISICTTFPSMPATSDWIDSSCASTRFSDFSSDWQREKASMRENELIEVNPLRFRFFFQYGSQQYHRPNCDTPRVQIRHRPSCPPACPGPDVCESIQPGTDSFRDHSIPTVPTGESH